jgi:alpha-amylase
MSLPPTLQPRPRSSRRLRRTLALASAALLAGGLIISAGLGADAKSPAAPPTPAPVPEANPAAALDARSAAARLRSSNPGVTASLWEWNWSSIASECPRLARYGYDGVQVAPPQNSLKRTAAEANNPGGTGSTVLHPWWEVYQVVSYDLTSRMGNENQFRQMVNACRRAGVKVYVDAVINHTTGQGSTSYGGQTYSPYNYPAIPYNRRDFHVPNGECTSSDGGIQDFNNKNQVFKCNLVGLEDLDTDKAGVRRTLAAYLNKLLSYGVSGFRVDAAKHVGQDDLDAIYSRLNRNRDGQRPYWALEVFQGGPGILAPQAFTRSGDVLGLPAAEQIRNAFESYTSEQIGSLATLEVLGTQSGVTASRDTMSFVTNHDTDRNGPYLSYKDGARYILANMWLLADGYGSPQVYSSFTWGPPANPPANATADDRAGKTQSPPSNANGLITDTNCNNGQWTCDHRNRKIVAMIGWHNYVGNAPRRNFYTDDLNVVAFSKGNRGWAAFNNNLTEAKTIRVQTGMAAGDYRDAVNGTTIRVNRNGVARVTIGALNAVAFDRTDRI